MPTFPSQEWMDAYAEVVASHPRADALTTSLRGRYRFVVTAGGGWTGHAAHDLVVAPGAVHAEAAAPGEPTTLKVTADYGRWRGLITGRSDLLMAFLLRRIRVEGDLGSLRERVTDAGPLLDCLAQVPTRFEH